METKKIAFMNQKGGVGKTTLIKATANYLSGVKKKSIAAIDCDIQQSLKGIYDKDIELFSEEKSFDVIACDLEELKETLDILEDKTDIEYYLIDLPGQLNDNRLLEVFDNIDVYITPFSYDRETFQSTHTFASVLKQINPESQIYFVPNKIKGSVKYDLKKQVDAALEEFGIITSQINDLVAYQRLRLYHLDKKMEEEIGEMLKFLKL